MFISSYAYPVSAKSTQNSQNYLAGSTPSSVKSRSCKANEIRFSGLNNAVTMPTLSHFGNFVEEFVDMGLKSKTTEKQIDITTKMAEDLISEGNEKTEGFLLALKHMVPTSYAKIIRSISEQYQKTDPFGVEHLNTVSKNIKI